MILIISISVAKISICINMKKKRISTSLRSIIPATHLRKTGISVPPYVFILKELNHFLLPGFYQKTSPLMCFQINQFSQWLSVYVCFFFWCNAYFIFGSVEPIIRFQTYWSSSILHYRVTQPGHPWLVGLLIFSFFLSSVWFLVLFENDIFDQS